MLKYNQNTSKHKKIHEKYNKIQEKYNKIQQNTCKIHMKYMQNKSSSYWVQCVWLIWMLFGMNETSSETITRLSKTSLCAYFLLLSIRILALKLQIGNFVPLMWENQKSHRYSDDNFGTALSKSSPVFFVLCPRSF